MNYLEERETKKIFLVEGFKYYVGSIADRKYVLSQGKYPGSPYQIAESFTEKDFRIFLDDDCPMMTLIYYSYRIEPNGNRQVDKKGLVELISRGARAAQLEYERSIYSDPRLFAPEFRENCRKFLSRIREYFGLKKEIFFKSENRILYMFEEMPDNPGKYEY